MSVQISSFEEYQREYARSVADPEGFWAEQAASFTWQKPWKTTLKWNFKEPKVEWFVGGKMNITENCLDRHLETRAKQTALIWEPKPANSPTNNSTNRCVSLPMPSKTKV
jgi:acetyl-CoA synthetase